MRFPQAATQQRLAVNKIIQHVRQNHSRTRRNRLVSHFIIRLNRSFTDPSDSFLEQEDVDWSSAIEPSRPATPS